MSYPVPTVNVTPIVHQVTVATGVPGARGPIGEAQPIIWTRDGEVGATVGQLPYRFLFDAVLVSWTAALGTACTGSPIIIDLNLNGTTLFPDQDDRMFISPNVTAPPVIPLGITVSEGDFLTLDVDDVGSTLSGEDLSVFVRYEKV
jgi:hypothetical protein